MSDLSLVQATQAYVDIQNRPIDIGSNRVQKASQFQQAVEKQFNSFANLSQDQILSKIKSSQYNLSTKESSLIGVVSSVTRAKLKKNERTLRKSLIGEASALELMTTVTEAKNTVEVMVKLRDEFLKSLEKIMGMAM